MHVWYGLLKKDRLQGFKPKKIVRAKPILLIIDSHSVQYYFIVHNKLNHTPNNDTQQKSQDLMKPNEA